MKSKMKSTDDLDKEIDDIIYAGERGGGFGGGIDQERELNRRVTALQQRQVLILEKRNMLFTVANVLIAALNLGLLAYQIFFI